MLDGFFAAGWLGPVGWAPEKGGCVPAAGLEGRGGWRSGGLCCGGLTAGGCEAAGCGPAGALLEVSELWGWATAGWEMGGREVGGGALADSLPEAAGLEGWAAMFGAMSGCWGPRPRAVLRVRVAAVTGAFARRLLSFVLCMDVRRTTKEV